MKKIWFFLGDNNILKIILTFSFIINISFIITSIFKPSEFFPGAGDIYIYIHNLCTSYIVGYIIYIITTEIPLSNSKKIIYEQLWTNFEELFENYINNLNIIIFEEGSYKNDIGDIFKEKNNNIDLNFQIIDDLFISRLDYLKYVGFKINEKFERVLEDSERYLDTEMKLKLDKFKKYLEKTIEKDNFLEDKTYEFLKDVQRKRIESDKYYYVKKRKEHLLSSLREFEDIYNEFNKYININLEINTVYYKNNIRQEFTTDFSMVDKKNNKIYDMYHINNIINNFKKGNYSALLIIDNFDVYKNINNGYLLKALYHLLNDFEYVIKVVPYAKKNRNESLRRDFYNDETTFNVYGVGAFILEIDSKIDDVFETPSTFIEYLMSNLQEEHTYYSIKKNEVTLKECGTSYLLNFGIIKLTGKGNSGSRLLGSAYHAIDDINSSIHFNSDKYGQWYFTVKEENIHYLLNDFGEDSIHKKENGYVIFTTKNFNQLHYNDIEEYISKINKNMIFYINYKGD